MKKITCGWELLAAAIIEQAEYDLKSNYEYFKKDAMEFEQSIWYNNLKELVSIGIARISKKEEFNTISS